MLTMHQGLIDDVPHQQKSYWPTAAEQLRTQVVLKYERLRHLFLLRRMEVLDCHFHSVILIQIRIFSCAQLDDVRALKNDTNTINRISEGGFGFSFRCSISQS
jgi:hypothetical protein